MKRALPKRDQWWERYKVDVPEGQSGRIKVERYEISEDEANFENMRMSWKRGGGYYFLHPGRFTRLTEGGTLWMSDTSAEVRSHLSPIHRIEARAGEHSQRVLINGLGLGLVLGAMLRTDAIEHVTVIERSPDVIALVGPHYEALAAEHGTAIDIIEADALEYTAPRGARFDLVWHDIWANVTPGNIPTMSTLHRKYGRRTRWQDSWARSIVKAMQRDGGW